MQIRRLGDGKYNNQQRLGLGGKGGDSGQLVAVVDGTVAAAAAVYVQTVAVDGAAVRRQWQQQSYHGQLGISLVFPPFDVQGGILVSTKAAHVGSTDWNRYCPLFPDFLPWTLQSAAQWSNAICVRERILWGECQEC
jgi:hypothetical protein